ncbi:MAG: carbohydrate ABC transporter permease [Aristaeellaceae bacterium]
MVISRRSRNRIRRTTEDKIVDAVVYLICILVFVVTFYPFWLSIVLAFNEGKDATYGGIYFWPRRFTLDNFRKMFSDVTWIKALGVSVARTVAGTILTVFMTTFVSYGLSHRNLIGRKVYMTLFIVAMYLSGGVIPYYMVLRQLHLINTFWVYIIPGMLSLFYVMVSISFFQDIPQELGESARLDGASELQIFLKIVLPISLPLLATIAIFTAVGHWNNWYDTAFFTQDKNLRTMAYQLMAVINKSSLGQNSNMDAYAASLANETVTNMSVQLAAMIVAVAPILVVYPFFQRYFVSGLTIGSVKG